ncbi:MAG: hypothetical protein AAGK04_04650 [Planctomycetota bacterium]
MTRSQRRVHLVVWLTLPVVLLGLIGWAASVRPSVAPPPNGATP